MTGIARENDAYGMGGFIFGRSSPDVEVNGRPVALDMSMYSPHICCGFSPKCVLHCFGVVFGEDAGVTVNGVAPLVQGSTGLCGHSVSDASENVIIVGAGGSGLLGSALGIAGGFVAGEIAGALGGAGGFTPGSVGEVAGLI